MISAPYHRFRGEGVYKLITKVLANPLKPLMRILVSGLQGVRVAGRQIQDICLITNELLDS